jgi:hypothetical protein
VFQTCLDFILYLWNIIYLIFRQKLPTREQSRLTGPKNPKVFVVPYSRQFFITMIFHAYRTHILKKSLCPSRCGRLTVSLVLGEASDKISINHINNQDGWLTESVDIIVPSRSRVTLRLYSSNLIEGSRTNKIFDKP